MLPDIVKTTFAKRFIDEVFQPQPLYSEAGIKNLFQVRVGPSLDGRVLIQGHPWLGNRVNIVVFLRLPPAWSGGPGGKR